MVRHILVVCLLLCSCWFVDLIEAAEAKPPNIVLILADDLGWTDLGCYGSKYYETPNIDRLRREGMKFTSAYTNAPNCAPTRACLMTGRYSPRHGIYTVKTGARGKEENRQMIPAPNVTDLPLEEVTLADAMQQAGYVTGMFGKWHLGKGSRFHPSQRGFDEAIQTASGHFAPRFKIVPPVKVPEGTYLTDFISEQAESFLERHQQEPFFLYLPHNAVHTPIEAKPEDIAPFKDKPAVGGHHDPVYAGMVKALDDSVGQVLDKLDELELTEKTIVLFFSDNGGYGGYPDEWGMAHGNITNNAPLRGGKGTLYEGGIRVPLIVRWPGKVKPDSQQDQPVIGLDLFPTFLEMAGVQEYSASKLDGESFVHLLEKEDTAGESKRPLFWHFPGYLQASEKRGTWRTKPGGGVRIGQFKLLQYFEDDRLELYDLSNDLSQQHNLAESKPQKVAQMLAVLEQWRRNVNAPMPQRKSGE